LLTGAHGYERCEAGFTDNQLLSPTLVGRRVAAWRWGAVWQLMSGVASIDRKRCSCLR
jgi:hypothetical protein